MKERIHMIKCEFQEIMRNFFNFPPCRKAEGLNQIKLIRLYSNSNDAHCLALGSHLIKVKLSREQMRYLLLEACLVRTV